VSNAQDPWARSFELLLRDYEQLRENERATGSALITLLTTVIALLGVIGFALIHQSDSNSPPAWMYTLLPAVPLPIMGLGLMLWVEAAVQHHYLVACERELHERVSPLSIDQAPVPSFVRLGAVAWSSSWRAFVGGSLIFGGLLALYLGATVDSFLVVWRRGSGLAWLFLLYALALVPVLFVFFEAALTDHLWRDAIRKLRDLQTSTRTG
jgi:hypothetical protein